jgi:hypothetical protein
LAESHNNRRKKISKQNGITLGIATAIIIPLTLALINNLDTIKDIWPDPPTITLKAFIGKQWSQVNEGSSIHLNGMGSQSTSGIVEYTWRYVSGVPPDDEHIKYGEEVDFQSPHVDRDETTTFQLKITDSAKNSDSTTETIKIRNLPEPPSPKISIVNEINKVELNNWTNQELVVKSGDILRFDGSKSYLPYQDEYQYEWKFYMGPQELIESNGAEDSSQLFLIRTMPDVNTDTRVVVGFYIKDSNGKILGYNSVFFIVKKDIQVNIVSSPQNNGHFQLLDYSPYDLTSEYNKVSAMSMDNLQSDFKSDIYPIKVNGENWKMSNDNFKDNRTVLNDGEFKKNPDGSWKITSSSKDDRRGMHYYIYTNDYANERSQVQERDQTEFAKRGYIFNINDWKNIEITAYMKINEITGMNPKVEIDVRGDKHTAGNECVGTSYNTNLSVDGNLQLSKEQYHPHKVTSESTNIGNIKGEWIGLKTIVYNQNQEGKETVKIEHYVDRSNRNGIWIKMDEKVDDGNWGTLGDHCNGKPDQILTWGGPVVGVEFKGIDDADIENFRINEIQLVT